jgi:lysozyme family protein
MTATKTRQQLFDTIEVSSVNIEKRATDIVNSLIKNKSRYEDVSHKFPNPGFVWYIVALIHQMECSQDFTKYLGNGQPLNKVTTMVPKGRGPFRSFTEGAIDALGLQGVNEVNDWSIGGILYFLEGYNGYGYAKYHPEVNTPYLWSGSSHYTKGKYVETKGADGAYHTAFNPNLVSDQVGIALMLKLLVVNK